MAAVTGAGPTAAPSADRVCPAVVRAQDPTALAEVLAGDDPPDVVLVAPARWARPAGLQAALAAGRHPGSRVATLVVPGGPLAVREAVLAAAPAADRRGLGPAGAVALVEAVLDRGWSGAWLPTVARLSDPSPSLGQHVRSWVPGGDGFVAVHTPEPGVHAVAGGDLPASRRPARVVASGSLPEAARRALVELLGAPADVVEAAGDPREVYGTARAVEVVGLPDADALDLGEPVGCCPVCSEQVRAPLCPLCRVRLESTAGSDGAVRSGAPGRGTQVAA